MVLWVVVLCSDVVGYQPAEGMYVFYRSSVIIQGLFVQTLCA